MYKKIISWGCAFAIVMGCFSFLPKVKGFDLLIEDIFDIELSCERFSLASVFASESVPASPMPSVSPSEPAASPAPSEEAKKTDSGNWGVYRPSYSSKKQGSNKEIVIVKAEHSIAAYYGNIQIPMKVDGNKIAVTVPAAIATGDYIVYDTDDNPVVTMWYDAVDGVIEGVINEPGTYKAKTRDSVAFVDVPAEADYKSGIDFVVGRQIMNGLSNEIFAPDAPITRAMAITTLYRLVKFDASGDIYFTDVPQGTWYTEAVEWAKESAVTNGIGDGMFGSDLLITRQQAAQMMCFMDLYNRNYIPSADLSVYTDADQISLWAVPGLKYTLGLGIFTSDENGKINPHANVTRAEFATYIARLIQSYGE